MKQRSRSLLAPLLLAITVPLVGCAPDEPEAPNDASLAQGDEIDASDVDLEADPEAALVVKDLEQELATDAASDFRDVVEGDLTPLTARAVPDVVGSRCRRYGKRKTLVCATTRVTNASCGVESASPGGQSVCRFRSAFRFRAVAPSGFTVGGPASEMMWLMGRGFDIGSPLVGGALGIGIPATAPYGYWSKINVTGSAKLRSRVHPLVITPRVDFTILSKASGAKTRFFVNAPVIRTSTSGGRLHLVIDP